jgi:hypothetical protein
MKVNGFLFVVTSIDAIKLADPYLQEQLEKVLSQTLNIHKPKADAAAQHVRILFNTNNITLPPPPVVATVPAPTTTGAPEVSALHVSYCYPTKEWLCLYRCEINSSIPTTNDVAKVDVTLFGSINNPTEEDWSQVDLILVANELEILKNNKSATVATASSTRDDSRGSGESSGGGMRVFVKTLTGKTVTIEVGDYISSRYLVDYRILLNLRLAHQVQQLNS